MTFPPETPQDYCDYFQSMALNAKPPNPKWGIGLKASQLWKGCRDEDNLSVNEKILISIVKILMPVSHSGSILLDLWGQILRHVAKLSVSEQKEIWLEVFNVENQGENIIKHNEVALKILQEWEELDINAESNRINENILMDLVDKVYLYTFSDAVWISFTVSIGEWFKKYIDEPSFYDSVCGKFEKKSN